MDDIYRNIQEYISNKKQKILIVFDKSLNPTVIELFVTRRKLNISLVLLHNLTSLFQKILK